MLHPEIPAASGGGTPPPPDSQPFTWPIAAVFITAILALLAAVIVITIRVT